MASVEEVTEFLRSAVKAVQDAEVPDHLQPVALGKAFDAIAGVEQRVPSHTGRRRGDAGRGEGTPPDTSSPLERIAAKLDVDAEDVSEIFEVDGEDLHLTIRRDQLSEDRREALREVALLVVAGRQSAELDEERTHTNVVRKQGEEWGLVAKNTFQEEMGGLGNIVTSRRSGAGRELKVTRHGLNEAGDLVRRMTDAGTP